MLFLMKYRLRLKLNFVKKKTKNETFEKKWRKRSQTLEN